MRVWACSTCPSPLDFLVSFKAFRSVTLSQRVQKKLKQICATDNPRHCVRRATSETSSSSSSCLRLLNAEENKSDRLSLRNVCRVWDVATLRTRRPKFLLSYQIQMGWNRQMLFSTATPSHTSPAHPCCRRGRGGMLSVVL